MWRPTSWSDLEAAVTGALPEAHDLDFKQQLSNNKELAKDVAAMTVHGGTIVIGIAENANGEAAATHPNALAGLPERIHQVVNSSVRPAPAIELTTIQEKAGDPDGVVAIVVPPSIAAPHEWEGRFPARAGATTRYMTEPEIEALYTQRRRFAEEAAAARAPLEDWVPPEGVTAGSGYGGIGRLELLVQPIAPVVHPFGFRLRRPLDEAVKRAEIALASKTAEAPKALGWLWQWQPRGTVGWTAGSATTDFNEMVKAGVLVSATVSYPARFSAYVTMSLDGGGGREAFEHLWMQEAIALLQIAGEFFSETPGVGLLRTELRLANLEGAVSSLALHKLKKQSKPVADSAYTSTQILSPRELVAEPERCAVELLDRLFVSFVPDEIDVLTESGWIG